SVTDSYTVKVNTVNSAPSIVKSGGGGTYDVGQSPSFVTTFKDDDGDKLEVSFDDGGSGLKIGQLVNNSVTVSGTLSKAGTFTVKVTAKDPDGASVTDSYTVKVIVVNVNSPPEVDKSGDGGTFTAGTKVSFLSRFKDDDNDPLEISANTGGSGLTMEEPNNNNAVAVSGTLNQIGTFTIKVTAKDLVGGASVTDSYIVKVDSAGANTNP
ncbi:MAG: hypothetical protein KDJ38_13930, partial [Gammaproteobacteria bacterium]|nr:hypothetical protein [Gammaproteobacteria bacterium]